MIALSSGTLMSAQAQDRAQIEHELAVTAYNYAVGCAERGKYNEALEGLTHIPGGRLNEQQLGWVDSLRTKCELMAGHPMPAHEIPLAESELIDIDDLGDPLQDGRFLDGGGVGEGADDGEQGHDESEFQEDDPLVVEGGFLCFLRFHGFGVLCCFVRCKGTATQRRKPNFRVCK